MRGAVYDLDPEPIKHRRLVVEDLAPAVDRGLARIVQRRGMGAVEVQALLDGAVEARQEDPAGAELDREVDGLKAAVRPPSDDAALVGHDLVDLADPDDKHAGILQGPGLGQAKAAESADPGVLSPPGGVASVEDVCPGDEPPGVVDGDPVDVEPFRRVPRCFKVDEPV